MRAGLAVAVLITLGTPAAAQSAAPATVPAAPAAPAKAEAPGYTYHAEGRRDPFVSLLRRAEDVPRGAVGVRSGGLSGLATAEVTLKGVLQGREGYLGILLGADSKSYIVRAGDRLLDGTVRTIAADSLVIVQQQNDPLAPRKQQDVRKTLRQLEEAK